MGRISGNNGTAPPLKHPMGFPQSPWDVEISDGFRKKHHIKIARTEREITGISLNRIFKPLLAAKRQHAVRMINAYYTVVGFCQ